MADSGLGFQANVLETLLVDALLYSNRGEGLLEWNEHRLWESVRETVLDTVIGRLLCPPHPHTEELALGVVSQVPRFGFGN